MLVIASFAQDSPVVTETKKEKKAAKREKANQIAKLQEEEEPFFNKHSIFGIKLNTDGYGISYEKGIYKSPRRTTVFQFEFNEKKHPKEEKLSSGDFIQFSQLIYGKVNNFYQFKLGIGQQRLIGSKANKNGISVSGIGAGGFTLGLLKPYFYETVTSTQPRVATGRKTFEQVVKDNDLISNSAGFFYGWGEVKVAPGLHLKTALRFDYGRYSHVIGAIEAGVNLEYYFTDIKQLAYEDPDRDPTLPRDITYVEPKNLFFGAYISVLFGKRK